MHGERASAIDLHRGDRGATPEKARQKKEEDPGTGLQGGAGPESESDGTARRR